MVSQTFNGISKAVGSVLHLHCTYWVDSMEEEHWPNGQVHPKPYTSGIEDELWNLSTLDSSPIGTVRGALELEGYLSTLYFCHSFLPKVAELTAIQDSTGSVEGVLLHLDWMLKPDWECVAGSI